MYCMFSNFEFSLLNQVARGHLQARCQIGGQYRAVPWNELQLTCLLVEAMSSIRSKQDKNYEVFVEKTMLDIEAQYSGTAAGRTPM